MNENPDIPFFNISFEEAKKVRCAGGQTRETEMREVGGDGGRWVGMETD